MQRFFLPADAIKEDIVFFPPEIAHQISHLLRLNEGMQVQVLDGQGDGGGMNVASQAAADQNLGCFCIALYSGGSAQREIIALDIADDMAVDLKITGRRQLTMDRQIRSDQRWRAVTLAAFTSGEAGFAVCFCIGLAVRKHAFLLSKNCADYVFCR